MTTDIATRDGSATPAGASTSALVLWAYEAQQAARIATSLARTSFVPASLRGKPEDITAAILAGQELGLQPMATLRSMDVIQGTPALRAHAMRGLVQSKGHKVWLVEQTPERVVMRGQRHAGTPGEYEPEQESVWTIERAQQLGLTGKDQWKKQPQTMLTARATGEICRLVAADVLYAMPYAAEELDGDGPTPAVRITGKRVTTAEILGKPEQAGTADEAAANGNGNEAVEPTPLPEPATPEPSEPEPETLAADWPKAAQPPDRDQP